MKAYPGPLPVDADGIEFWSFCPPDTPLGPRVFWRTPRPPDVTWRDDGEVVVLRVVLARVTLPVDIVVS